MELPSENTFLVEVGLFLNCTPTVEVAFSFTYKNLYKSTHGYGMRLLNDGFTIDELVQDAFLKLWDYREQMTSLLHASRFLKQQVRWACYAHFRNPVSKFHRSFTYLDAAKDSDSIFQLAETQQSQSPNERTERQLKLITEVLPFLPSGRAKIFLKRYYTDGLSGTQIATQYNLHINVVHLELRRGVEQLKSIVVPQQEVFKRKHSDTSLAQNNISINLYGIQGLNREQSKIYRLRTEHRYEFSRIADMLDLQQVYVQLEYVKAWKVVSRQKKKTNSKTQKYNSTTISTSELHRQTDATLLTA